ncbi:hypothetical protein A9977_10255 [Variovorax sp. UMC13]|nr:hypothetical protein [Variovorax sp. UMC13]
MFMSAALGFGKAVAGVILTGTMEDGTAGLQAVKACGGLALVQDPVDALAPEMPGSAMRYVAVDYCLPVASMGKLLTQWTQDPLPMSQHAAPSRLVRQMQLHAVEGDVVQHLEAIAHPSAFVCPDCKAGFGRSTERSRCDIAATPATASRWRPSSAP